MGKNIVFFYGTLKTGERNHHCTENALLIRQAVTLKNDFILAQFDSTTNPGDLEPGVQFAAKDGGHVEGELYAVDDAMMVELDKFEQVGIDYERQLIEMDDNSLAWVYLRIQKPVDIPSADIHYDKEKNLYRWAENKIP